METIRIDDPSDPRLGDYHLLNDQRARRTYEGDEFFIAEGYVPIDRVVDSDHHIRSILLTPSRVDRFAERLERIHHLRADEFEAPVFVVERDVIAAVVGFDLHRGVVASVDRRPLHSLDEVIAGPARRIAVLEGLNDAENVGVIARAARALGIDALVLDPTCTDPYARRTIRVSMGEVLHLPTARATDWPADLARLHDGGFETWSMTPAPDAVDLWAAPVPDRLAIVLGAEGPGLDDTTLRATTHRVRIPIDPAVDSLNVGHAAAITFAATGRPSASPQPGQKRS
ncbi:MAG: RNA methyltransferase [Actinomycetota bacterium]